MKFYKVKNSVFFPLTTHGLYGIVYAQKTNKRLYFIDQGG